jgi:hypothetical protein
VPKTVTVTAGDEPVKIAAIRAPSLDFDRSRNCIGPIAAERTCAIHVVFSPHKPGADHGTLVVVMGDGSEERITLTGPAVENHIKIRPHAVNFGNVPKGDRSRRVPVKVRNTGTTAMPLDIGGYADFGRRHPLGFDIQDRTCPSVLPGNGSCTLHVWFRPTSFGPASTVVVVLVGRDPLAFTVSGVGVPAPTS